MDFRNISRRSFGSKKTRIKSSKLGKNISKKEI